MFSRITFAQMPFSQHRENKFHSFEVTNRGREIEIMLTQIHSGILVRHCFLLSLKSQRTKLHKDKLSNWVIYIYD